MPETLALSLIILFTIILILVGYYYRHKKKPEDFFMAQRKVGVTRILASTFTLAGAGEIVTLTAFAYLYGYYGISLFLGIFAGFLFAAFIANRIRINNLQYKPYTLTDYIRTFLGPKSEKISIILSLIAVGSLLIIQLVVGGLLISTLTGLSYPSSVIIIGLVITLYLILGGFNSVLTTDVIQAIGMALLLLFLLVLYNPAGASLQNLVTNAQGIIPPIDFTVLLVLGFFAVLGGADVYQRIYAASSDSIARKGLIYTGFAFLIFGILMITLGLKIFSQFPDVDPNNAFFDFLSSDLSTVMIALLSIFIIASIFSSADTQLFLSSILIGRLIYSNKELSTVKSRILIGLITIIAIILAISFTSLVDIYFILLYAFLIIGPVMLARLFSRGNDNLAFLGMLVSLVLLIGLGIAGKLIGLYPLIIAIPPLITFFVPSKT